VTKIKKVYNIGTRSKPKTSLIHYGDDGGGASDGGDASKEDKSDPSNENLYLFKPGITFYRDFILLFVWTATFSQNGIGCCVSRPQNLGESIIK